VGRKATGPQKIRVGRAAEEEKNFFRSPVFCFRAAGKQKRRKPMKKVITLAVVLAMAYGFTAPAVYAATTSTAPITTTATVSSALTLSVVMRKNDFAGAVINSMNFGNLLDIGTGTLRSSPTSNTGTGAVAAFINANTQGAPYQITQTGTTLSNGTSTLPSGACTVVPVYAAADNGGAAIPAGASIGTKGTWIGSRTLYTSESGTAALRTIQAIYSVTDDPAAGSTAGVPLSQQAGTYSGTVTITATTV
jgi:hypothetical protein